MDLQQARGEYLNNCKYHVGREVSAKPLSFRYVKDINEFLSEYDVLEFNYDEIMLMSTEFLCFKRLCEDLNFSADKNLSSYSICARGNLNKFYTIGVENKVRLTPSIQKIFVIGLKIEKVRVCQLPI